MPPVDRDAPLYSFAPAKINLTLHVRRRRLDGYHDLESLVAFASEGDELHLSPGASLSLTIGGPAGGTLDAGGDNLVLKAVHALLERKEGLRTGAFHLVKKLPVSSGIGGGSTDAAAALRLIAGLNGLPLSDPDIRAAALRTGADVPVCLEGRARIMRGIGDDLGEALDLPDLPAVLVNPGFAVATPQVFQALGLAKGQEFRSSSHAEPEAVSDPAEILPLLHEGGNDLEIPAIAQCPDIRRALDMLVATEGCLLGRMSGSGATVFGLYPDFAKAESAAAFISARQPHWWVRSTLFR